MNRPSRMFVLPGRAFVGLPFLKRASGVTIIEICTSDEQDRVRRSVRDIGKQERHGAKSETDVRVHIAESDAHQPIRRATDHGAGLVVAGAYGHSRPGEWTFGGMTRDLLRDAAVCVLMSH